MSCPCALHMFHVEGYNLIFGGGKYVSCVSNFTEKGNWLVVFCFASGSWSSSCKYLAGPAHIEVIRDGFVSSVASDIACTRTYVPLSARLKQVLIHARCAYAHFIYSEQSLANYNLGSGDKSRHDGVLLLFGSFLGPLELIFGPFLRFATS